LRILAIIFVLAAMVVAAWLYAIASDGRETITPQGVSAGLPETAEVRAADGDSFAIGPRKFRLRGIDAPEWKQTCSDAAGKPWQCGSAAYASLASLLVHPSLSCEAEIQDRFNRSLAVCRTTDVPDIAAAQVSAGLAISSEFHGLREYGAEEDRAKAAKRGIWQGQFAQPKDWRSSHLRQ
jgi:endonuclease YncB( thermonuclease family)